MGKSSTALTWQPHHHPCSSLWLGSPRCALRGITRILWDAACSLPEPQAPPSRPAHTIRAPHGISPLLPGAPRGAAVVRGSGVNASNPHLSPSSPFIPKTVTSLQSITEERCHAAPHSRFLPACSRQCQPDPGKHSGLKKKREK